MRRVGAGARVLIRDVCTFEFLGLSTMLLPALMASVGFFFGQTVTPLYFYVSVAVLLVCAFVGGWRRGVAYVALLAVCTVLTMYTFSYTGLGYDVQTYHFPVQHLLRNGWNPVFDSTVEKFFPLLDGTQLWFYHTLFLPKFQELCGAIVSSAFRLFIGDAFLGYVLMACLCATSLRFARNYWNSGVWMRFLFAGSLMSSPKLYLVSLGYVDYSAYASFCIAALSLVLYRNGRKLSDLVLFVVAACMCMTTKTTGVLNVGLLVVLTLPLLWKRTTYWHALLALGFLVAVVGASPLLTNWIQYGSPFYPSMTFNPNVPVVDVTCDFDLTANADALSMGYLSRICYAWVSPKLTVAAIRLLGGDPDFSPVFRVSGRGVSGIGIWFNALLLFSVVLLSVSRKNLVTWLCVVIFASSNFAPLRFIGFDRYFPQIWAIFPLSAMNFICTTREGVAGGWKKPLRTGVSAFLALVLAVLAVCSLYRALHRQCVLLFIEGVRQKLIASIPKEVKVDELFCRYTILQRFRQAGIKMVKAKDDAAADTLPGNRDISQSYYLLQNLPHRDPVTSRLELPPKGETVPHVTKQTALLGMEACSGTPFAFYSDMGFDCPDEKWTKRLFERKGKLRALIDNFPHVLWDNSQGDSK